MARRALEALSFDNSYARLPESFHAKLNPTPFSACESLTHSDCLMVKLTRLELIERSIVSV